MIPTRSFPTPSFPSRRVRSFITLSGRNICISSSSPASSGTKTNKMIPETNIPKTDPLRIRSAPTTAALLRRRRCLPPTKTVPAPPHCPPPTVRPARLSRPAQGCPSPRRSRLPPHENACSPPSPHNHPPHNPGTILAQIASPHNHLTTPARSSPRSRLLAARDSRHPRRAAEPLTTPARSSPRSRLLAARDSRHRRRAAESGIFRRFPRFCEY